MELDVSNDIRQTTIVPTPRLIRRMRRICLAHIELLLHTKKQSAKKQILYIATPTLQSDPPTKHTRDQ